MNLGDPELELIDPTPNVHSLFIHFDKLFFWTKLASRAVVRWSKKMYSCAGICSYEGRGGLCDIALSEPLLKLRPRKDLIETLLHEMIHAYLFITNRDRERDGHGPNFQAHMHRINNAAGLNISIYHEFHDEVKLYLTHWWRCNGPCQARRPYFGVVRRNQNRAPGPSDYWWSTHQKTCGGTFAKIKEPEKKIKKPPAEKKAKKMGDITKYINNNNGRLTNNNKAGDIRKPLTPVKNVTNSPATKMKSNGGNTLVVTKKNGRISPVFKTPISKPPLIFSGKGQSVDIGMKQTKSPNVVEAVRNIWANKQLPTLTNSKQNTPKEKMMASSSVAAANCTIENLLSPGAKKHKIDADQNPPAKIKKIDDYFKSTATSILKNVYGEDFKLTQSNDDKIVAKKLDLVDCPICAAKIDSDQINRHLDECLNRDVIEKLSKDNIEIIGAPSTPASSSQPVNRKSLRDMVGVISPIPPFKMFKEENGDIKPNLTTTVDLTNINNVLPKGRITPANNTTTNFDQNDVNRVKAVVKKINYDKHVRKSDNFVVKEEPNNVDCGFLPSFLDDIGCAIKAPAVKIEPGTSGGIVSALKCPCCSKVINKPMAEHLDECLAFFNNNTTVPEEGASTSIANDTIVIDDDEDDIFDETQTFNATGTKTPCPCCLEMVESADMNNHLDICLS